MKRYELEDGMFLTAPEDANIALTIRKDGKGCSMMSGKRLELLGGLVYMLVETLRKTNIMQRAAVLASIRRALKEEGLVDDNVDMAVSVCGRVLPLDEMEGLEADDE